MTMVPVERQADILRAVGLDPRSALSQALVAVANRYGLDPLLKHVYIIRDTIYVSHAALLHIAHKSGDFDGMEVECEELPDKWVATARIYRRSYGHAFIYQDECAKNEQKVGDKRKRAITRAERNALRRAFDIVVDVEPEHVEKAVVMSPEAPPLPGEVVEAVDWRPAMILCREMELPEDIRHELVMHLTDLRTQSVKSMTAEEFRVLMHHLKDLKDGAVPRDLPDALDTKVIEWLREPESLTETPA